MECIKSKLKWDYESDASSSDDHKVAVFTEFDAVAWFHIPNLFGDLDMK